VSETVSPFEPLWHPHDLELRHLEIQVLDVSDVVVSKLKRFSSNDRSDIREMVEGGYVPHSRMLERVRGLVDRYQLGARCDALPPVVERFHQAERDWFGVAETAIELPEHVFR